ncbi:MAG: hypothetical protein JXR83_15215 [Deltaproteobacteria bacterium]|nr:hypothetical protein [Deltaproteobacteria bacterium]
MPKPRLQRTGLFFTVLLTVASAARADDAHYQDFAVGARGAMLGGAYTAIADDSSALYFNPAGLVDVDRANVSIATSLYGFDRQLTYARDVDAVRLVNELQKYPLTASEINIIPASTGAALALGPSVDGHYRHAVAAGLVVPTFRTGVHYVNRDQDALQLHNTSRVNDRTMIWAAGYGFRWTRDLSVGIAGQATVRLVDMVDEFDLRGAASAAPDQGAFLLTTSSLNLTHTDAMVALGLKWRLGRRMLFGASLTTPGLSLYQSGEFRTRAVSGNLDPAAAPELIEHASRVRWSGVIWPLSSRLGLAYTRPRDFTVSIDASLHAPTRYQLVADQCSVPSGVLPDLPLSCQLLGGRWTVADLPAEVQRRSLIPLQVDRIANANFNLGFEKTFSRQISLGVGGFTNFSSARPFVVDAGGRLTALSTQLSNVDHYGVTLSLGYFGAFSLSRLGVMAMYGRGETARPVSPTARIDNSARLALEPVATHEYLVYLFWSSTVRFTEEASPAP